MSNRGHKLSVEKPRVIKPESETELNLEKKRESSPAIAIRRFSVAVVRPSYVLSLQRTIGNRAVRRMVKDAKQERSRPGGNVAIRRVSTSDVVQRHAGSVPWRAADQIHNRLKTKISNNYKSSKRVAKAYYDHNAEKIGSLSNRIS